MKFPPVPQNTHAAGFAALRSTDGKYWLDTESFGMLREITAQKIAEERTRIPSWDDANPVVKIVRVILALDPSQCLECPKPQRRRYHDR